ncbi:Six-hairpin glycosidase-like protein [Coniochaeta sp. 2T2.1]|nr:Six-hairpin glycosidase-like protein [Coniochaeta sp. 2T2.1]
MRFWTMLPSGVLCLLICSVASATSCAQRRNVVRAFNVRRNASSSTTPLQVGNGNFAFGVDVTGLQTFNPFATLSTWGWHNFSLPTTPGQTSISDFTGLDWWTHGRLVNYNQPNPAENDISTWLIQNPQRVNLANIGFSFGDAKVSESDLQQTNQVLDLYSGKITSTFFYKGSLVEVLTWADPGSDSIGISVKCDLLSDGSLGVFFDFPYSDRNKFDAPFVGVWNATDKHSTVLTQTHDNGATILHTMDANSYFTLAKWSSKGKVTGPLAGTHRYVLTTPGAKSLDLTVAFTPNEQATVPAYSDLTTASKSWWRTFWNTGAFIDLTNVKIANATELQRRIILSQYLLAVNSASSNPPQESGLVNNGWYGKFHLEMLLWHTLPFALWKQFPLFWRSQPTTYHRFLSSSLDRAAAQGYRGARWGKMTDPTGRSAPGEINSLLIWQQPHPMYLAETEYRAYPNASVLEHWDEILTATADFMASFAWHNTSTGRYDLGPPMYPVSENTPPNSTINPTFELAYWRFGLDIAARWKQRLNKPVPQEWITVRDNLAPLPVQDDTYVTYEGIPGSPLDQTILKNTADKIRDTWALEESYGWDFSMLAMNSLRLGDVDQAVEYLLHPIFAFDDAGYAVGGSRVPTPYFPNMASVLIATAMMAGGWDGSPGPHFPKGWDVKVDGFTPTM